MEGVVVGFPLRIKLLAHKNLTLASSVSFKKSASFSYDNSFVESLQLSLNFFFGNPPFFFFFFFFSFSFPDLKKVKEFTMEVLSQ